MKLPRSLIDKILATRLTTFIAGLLFVTLIIISRKPILLFQPRFWWDEGSIHYEYAFNHRVWQTFIGLHQGYFSLIDNVTSVLQVTFVSIENAPFVSTYMAFFVMLLPHMVVWGGKSPYWNTPDKKLVTSLIILFNSMSCAIWLNVVTSQFHLSLLCFLILVEDWRNRSRACLAAYAFMLLVSGLSGVVSCFLMPLFFLKLVRENSKTAMVLAGVFGMATFVAFIAVVRFYLLRHEMFINELRFGHDIYGFFVKYIQGVLANIFAPIDGVPRRNRFHMKGIIAGYGLLLLGCAYFSRALKERGWEYFLGAFGLLSVMGLASSLSSSGNVRYFYAANVIIMLMVQQSFYSGSLVRRGLAVGLVAWVLLVGTYNFYFRYYCYSPDWPVWADEVRKWRGNHRYAPKGHPRGGALDWRVNLAPKGFSPK